MELDELFDADDYLYFLAQALADEDTEQQVAFVETALAMRPPMRVLDVGCGHGRHANALARRGFRVTGVDAVEGFLAVARRDAPVGATFVRGDIGALGLDAAVDRAICIYDVLGYADDDHARRTLAGIHRALVPGGALLLDLREREFLARLPAAAVLDLPNGDLMIDRYRLEGSRLFDHRTYLRGDRRRDLRFSVRVWTHEEMRELLAAAGFAIRAAYGGFDGAPPSGERHRVVLVCDRR